MIGTLATSHTTLNPTLRAPAQHHGTAAGQSSSFSRQLAGKFFTNNSLAATTHRKKMEARHNEKVRKRREKMEKTAEEHTAKLELQERKLARRKKREQDRRARRIRMMQLLTQKSTRIQALWRGFCVREKQREQAAAAARIQQPVRLWSARRRKLQQQMESEFNRQRFQEAAMEAAAMILQRNYKRHRRRVARLRAVVVVQNKVRKQIRNRTTFRIVGAIGKWRRAVCARRIQKVYARFRQIKERSAYLAAIEEAARRKREADTARQNNLRRDFQRRRHLLINKMYRDSAISLLERMMEPRGVNLDLQFRSDGADIKAPKSKKEEKTDDNMKFVATATNLRARLQQHRQRRRAKAKSAKPAPAVRKPTPKQSSPSNGKPGWNGHFMRPASSHRKLLLDDDPSRPSSRSGLRSRDGGRYSDSRPGTSSSRPGTGLSRGQLRSRGGSRLSSAGSRRIAGTPTRRRGNGGGGGGGGGGREGGGGGRRRSSRSAKISRGSSRPGSSRSRPSSSSSDRQPKGRRKQSSAAAKQRSQGPGATSKKRRQKTKKSLPPEVMSQLSSKRNIGHFTAEQLSSKKIVVEQRGTIQREKSFDAADVGKSGMVHLGKAELLILDKVTSTDQVPRATRSTFTLLDNDEMLERHMQHYDSNGSVGGMPTEYFANVYASSQADESLASLNEQKNSRLSPKAARAAAAAAQSKRVGRPGVPRSKSEAVRSAHSDESRLLPKLNNTTTGSSSRRSIPRSKSVAAGSQSTRLPLLKP